MTDIAIIGTGVAGLSAAITAAARNKSIMLFGDPEVGGKLSAAHEIKNFLGFFGKSSEEITAELKNHLSALNIQVTPKKITNIYKMGDYFSLLSGQDMFEAKKVIIASGVSFGKPLTGEIEFLGRGVSYCATCDGMLHKGKPVAVIAYSKKQEEEALFLSEICQTVYYFKMYKEEAGKEITENQKIQLLSAKDFAISGQLKATALKADGTEYQTSCVFILRDNIPPAQLIAGIQMDGNHIQVDRQMRTNIEGLFAAGDITGTPYQYAKAAGEGNVAALSAVSQAAGND